MDIDKNKINQIAEKFDLELLVLFGSQVDKDVSKLPDSDVDIAYQSSRKLTGKEMINLNCELMDVFKNDRVDMVNLKSANPLLMHQISKKCKLIYGKKLDFLNFKALAFRLYIDHLDLFDLESKLIRRRQELLGRNIYG